MQRSHSRERARCLEQSLCQVYGELHLFPPSPQHGADILWYFSQMSRDRLRWTSVRNVPPKEIRMQWYSNESSHLIHVLGHWYVTPKMAGDRVVMLARLESRKIRLIRSHCLMLAGSHDPVSKMGSTTNARREPSYGTMTGLLTTVKCVAHDRDQVVTDHSRGFLI